MSHTIVWKYNFWKIIRNNFGDQIERTHENLHFEGPNSENRQEDPDISFGKKMFDQPNLLEAGRALQWGLKMIDYL